MSFVLSLDQGTTSSRSIVFDARTKVRGSAQREFPQIYPSPGHVEHDPEAIWKTQMQTARAAIKKAGIAPNDLAAIGITNQRETVVLWDRDTGKPVDNAIVWQSRITAPICEKLKRSGYEGLFRARTGLVVDAYFSGTKIQYLLDKHKLRRRAQRGEILAGTIDTFLLWRLTDGAVHATDYSNASRTLLFNIHTLSWDQELLDLLGVPREMLPEVKDSSGLFGLTSKRLLGASVPVAGIAGDQQAATFGQGCFKQGMVKNTYGTGCFILMNTGEKAVTAESGLLTTIGWGIGGKVTYCLEGSVFIGGAAVQWLRDGLGLFRRSEDVEKLAGSVPDSGGVFFVPAFVGLGTPHWDPYARGLIIGIERGTTKGHVARATVDSMAYQSHDVVRAMEGDSGVRLRELRVDGGASVNDSLMQFQADLLGVPVVRSATREATAQGAAFLAGLAVGVWPGVDALRELWRSDRVFQPRTDASSRLQTWKRAVERARSWASNGND